MADHNTYVVTGWARFFVIWGRVLVGLCVLVIVLWLLSAIFSEDNQTGVDTNDALVSDKPIQLTEDTETNILPDVIEDQPDLKKDVNVEPQYQGVTDIDVLRVYFDIGSDVVPLAAINDLRPTVEYLMANKSTVAILSGYHDASGRTEINQRISKKRATAVRDFLVAEGVDIDRLILKKPQKSQGSGAPSEARRVEVEIATVR